MTYPPRLFRVHATTHARVRARERFPGYKAARISDEVRAAFAAGRVSARGPRGVQNEDMNLDCWFAWTADGSRVFVLTHNDDSDEIVVKTVIRVDPAA
jgi:hypothetical protein